ncbi:MAG: enoyl-CoA hydratase/isomerase family protein [Bacteroidetes bacterium]|nr:enoyl-CoA hydratase/isomerase family protein [Bacteroidota bacterium]
MQYTAVKYSIDDYRATIELPDDTSSITYQAVVSELSHALLTAQKNSNVRVVILKSQKEDWYSGLSKENMSSILKFDFSQNLHDSTELVKIFQQIHTLRKPVLSVVKGKAFSLSCGIVAASDFAFAAKETARFGFPEVQCGLFPAAALYFLTRRVGDLKVRELMLKKTILNAEEAYTYGLVNILSPEVELEETVNKFVENLLRTKTGMAIGLLKELLFRVQGMSLNDALEYAANLNALSRMTDDFKKGIESLMNNKFFREDV